MSLRAVVLAHNLLDGLARFVGVVERDSADVVVQNMCLNDTVEELAANEAKFAVNGGSSTASEVPNLRLVVRESRVGVLKVGNGNCNYTLPQNCCEVGLKEAYRASGSPRDTEFHTTQGD